ncbi:MAG: 4-hydroxythreonine-4-phosphate dehydrogenase PdxA [Thermodesulfovibrionales bacterium]|nr:4-hydroxythreonine-4-phosphate dehydrogenase PdxA [Thermodesulfovibrionales bacterium]
MRKLAITIGDPGGIGPEVTLKAVLRLKAEEGQGLEKDFVPVIIGDRIVIEEASGLLKGENLDIVYTKPEEVIALAHRPSTIYFIDTGLLKDFKKSIPSSEGGYASVEYIKIATDLAIKGYVHGIVTAPISKTSLKRAGYTWPGHTELLKELTNAEDVAMLFYAPPVGASDKGLKIILATIHVALKDVPSFITEEKVFKTILFAQKGMEMFGFMLPRIGVAGLNPHAGEEGLFGDEEIKVIAPAIRKAKEQGLRVFGPLPPDIIFYKALHDEYDIVVSMYHDQGLAPLKLIAFERAVNITVGLPIIRTSPDHGTASDIAWKGIANPSSMIEAIKVALKLRI